MRVMRILADTTNRIAEGEVLQLLNIGNPDTGEAAYLDVIERKTAVLFAAATRLGAVLGGLSSADEDALARYGLDLGFAFQIADDVLDYASDASTLGKNIGDDLAEGKPTLPLIHAIARSEPAEAERLRAAVRTGGREALGDVLKAIRATGALDYARERAHGYARSAREALSVLAPSDERDALALLADYAIDRSR
jgi:octaprenyl-diphosphate synthase